MNKKANLSLVILSIVALFGIGGLVIMQGGVAGAAAASIPMFVVQSAVSNTPSAVVINPVNQVTIGIKSAGPVFVNGKAGTNVFVYSDGNDVIREPVDYFSSGLVNPDLGAAVQLSPGDYRITGTVTKNSVPLLSSEYDMSVVELNSAGRKDIVVPCGPDPGIAIAKNCDITITVPIVIDIYTSGWTVAGNDLIEAIYTVEERH